MRAKHMIGKHDDCRHINQKAANADYAGEHGF
jgi:hypothetical protein